MDSLVIPIKRAVGSKDPKARKMIKAFVVVTARRHSSEGLETKYKWIWKDEDPEQVLDQNSIGLMCLPDGVESILSDTKPCQDVEDYLEPEGKFHSFLVTRENGHRFYGSSLISCRTDQVTGHVVIESYCLVTTIPFVVAMEKLLRYFVLLNLESQTIQRICKLRLPANGKCLKLLLPDIDKRGKPFQWQVPDNVFIFRGTSDFPLLDHPLRHLFSNVLNPHNFILIMCAALLEFQVLIISKDYQEMMSVSECLTALLLPFQWQHVYVPILPSQLGLHYLDAPTPYIMGINAEVYATACSSFPSLSTHTSQVRVFCSDNRIEFIPGSDLEMEGFHGDISLHSLLPPFLVKLMEDVETVLKSNMKLVTQETRIRSKSLVLERVTQVARKHQLFDTTFNYVDDLKLNHVLRVLFTTTLEQNLLRDCDKFVISCSTSTCNSGVKFDSVSFLSDQPEVLVPFFSKFLETQMFASLIDVRFKNPSSNRCMRTSTFLDGKQKETGFSMDNLQQLKESVDKVFDGAFEDATAVDLNESDLSKSCVSPRSQRKVYKNLHTMSNNTTTTPPTTTTVNNNHISSNHSVVPGSSSEAVEMTSLASEDENNWRIIESLLKETRTKTKRILLEKMGREGDGSLIQPAFGSSDEGVEGNALITSLCDLIERVWSHGALMTSSGSYFWDSLSSYSREQVNGVQEDRLSMVLNSVDTRGSYSLISSSSGSRSTPASPMKSRSSILHHHSLMEPLPVSLLRDILSVQRMNDVKTDLGKSRVFIRLSLERKCLSQHLRELLDHQDLEESYEKHSFLRSEEEKEQFLTHLLTLNAVDLLCFTHSFTTSFLSEYVSFETFL